MSVIDLESRKQEAFVRRAIELADRIVAVLEAEDGEMRHAVVLTAAARLGVSPKTKLEKRILVELTSSADERPLRKCEFCGCETNAALRGCCADGRLADSRERSP